MAENTISGTIDLSEWLKSPESYKQQTAEEENMEFTVKILFQMV